MTCAHEYGPMDRYCGVRICVHCGHHKGLARCFCGWSEFGDDGAAELREMGENLEPEDGGDPFDIEYDR